MSIEPTTTVHVDVLAGHIGHLTDAQEKAFVMFKELLAQASLYTAPSEEGGVAIRASHDDPTLL